MGVPITTKGRQLLAVLWIEVCISIAFIGLRLYTRKYVGGAVGLDDWILLATWCFMLAFAACISVAVSYGMGAHANEISLDNDMKGIMWLCIGQFLISMAMGLSKCAVAVFLIRIVNQTWHKMVLYFWIVTMMGLSILLGISVFAQCVPVQSIWDSRIKGVCTLNLTLIAKIMCSWSAAMDFFLAMFPWLIIWKLNMKPKEKIVICVSLSLGIMAGICGVVRITTLDSLSETSDYLYAVSDSVMWTMSESTVTIICVSIPALRPLYNRLTGGSSTGGLYQNYGENKKTPVNSSAAHAGPSYNLKTLNRTTTKAAPRNQYDVEIGHDTDSDTSILQHDAPNDGRIRRQQDVTVTYEDGMDAVSSKQHV